MTERRALCALGAVQGLALWLLYEHWPDAAGPAALFTALVWFVVAGGLVLHMARVGRERPRLFALALGVGLAFGAIAFWVGWQLPAEGTEHAGDERRLWTLALGSAIALFVLGPFLQIYQRSGQLRFAYTQLYEHSWSNFFVAALALLYLNVVWIVLVVWAALFDLIGIDLFAEWFREEVFAFTLTGGALGYGLAAARENETVIVALRGITQTLFRAMLPAVALVTLGFLAALPFTGLEELFGASSAATVLLWWLVLGTLLLNAVYLDGGSAPPYAPATRRIVEAATLVAPALAGLALYALWLRIAQHGLTPDRMLGLLFAGMLGSYAVGYAVAVALRAEPWLGHVKSVNVALAGAWVALVFAVHTPLLDPLGWSLRHQLGRLSSGAVDPLDFDYAYLRFHLGERGARALERIVASPQHLPEVRERLDLALSVESYWEWTRDESAAADSELALQRSHDAPWPGGLRAAIRNASTQRREIRRCGEVRRPRCWVVPSDLDGDGAPEELLVTANDQRLMVFVFALEPGAAAARWEQVGLLAESPTGNLPDPELGEVLAAIRSGSFRKVAPRYREVQIGDRRLRFDPF